MLVLDVSLADVNLRDAIIKWHTPLRDAIIKWYTPWNDTFSMVILMESDG